MRRFLPRTNGIIFLMLALATGCTALSVPDGFSENLSSTSAEESEPRGVEDEMTIAPPPRKLDDEGVSDRPAELPAEVDEGPADGLTLQAAVNRLLHGNIDLAILFQDIPKAEADVVSASLRNNPVFFVDVSNIPYGRYSPRRPGAVQYDITLVQPIDVNGKHKNNTRAARKVLPVLQAYYQDAVRRKVDDLFSAYVHVLETRAIAEATRVRLQRLGDTVETARQRAEKGQGKDKIGWAMLRLNNARLTLRKRKASLRQARRDLAALLEMPNERADDLRLRGALRQPLTPPPKIEELIRIALRSRPDLAALRLSLHHAQAVVRREKSEWLDDLFLFFSPFQLSDMSPQNKSSSTSWQIGVLVPVPIFNRNQGEIARARADVTQRRIEIDQKKQQIIEEVHETATAYAESCKLVRRYEGELLPQARLLQADNSRRFADGDKDVNSYLTAQKSYSETVNNYLHALARHRRARLRLNTVAGQRIFP